MTHSTSPDTAVPFLRISVTSEFETVDNSLIGSVYRPKPADGFHSIGDYTQGNNQPSGLPVVTLRAERDDAERPLLVRPTTYAFTAVLRQVGEATQLKTWLPIPPPGYVPLGMVAAVGPSGPSDPPSIDLVRCLRFDFATPAPISEVWRTELPGLSDGVFRIDQTHTLWVFAEGRRDGKTHNKPPAYIPRGLGDS
ncbi:MAG: Vps62-related protein [Acidobacteriota bacterium]